MEIKDSVGKFFALTMPCETNDFKPSVEELFKLWKGFKVDSSELSYEFSSHLPSLKSAPEITIVKKIIKICHELSLFAEENIIEIDDIINAKRHFDDQQVDLVNFVDGILSLFSNKPTELQKKKSSYIKKAISKSDRLEKKYNDLDGRYFNVCYQAERVFFKTFNGKPI